METSVAGTSVHKRAMNDIANLSLTKFANALLRPRDKDRDPWELFESDCEAFVLTHVTMLYCHEMSIFLHLGTNVILYFRLD